MKKNYKNYFFLSVMLVLIGLIVGNCGGGDDTGAVPNVSGNSAQTQNLVTKDVAGFVYATSSLSSSKDGEEEETVFSILDIPINGEDGFISQVNEYIQETASSKGSSPETEELLTAFTEEAGQYQPLPVWNSVANIYSSYADSLSSSPVPITSEGEISGSVLVGASDDLVSLDIEVSGEEYYETEAISSSDLLNSSNASGEYVLKSCPGKIIIKPGDCKIFEVFSKPSVNLFDAGLQFSIANPEFGTVCGPIYLRCDGAKKYSVAYGVIYAKKNVETPLDTTINVTTTQGQNLSIPVQIVKKTAVVSGKVYASGPIVKGYVISQGPKSQCKINEDGTYSLPKVWQGTGRKITATWWTQEGSVKVRHRETKFVDVFGDMTVDFGGSVEPTPVPTARHPFDPYYKHKAMFIMMQRDIWAEELGLEMEQAVQMTVQWLNGKMEVTFQNGGTMKLSPPEGIVGAIIDKNYPTTIWVKFTDGMSRFISNSVIVLDDTMNSQRFSQKQTDKEIYNKLRGVPTTVSNKIVILDPFAWQFYDHKSVYGEIYDDLYKTGVYDITRKVIEPNDINEEELLREGGRNITDFTVATAEAKWGSTYKIYVMRDLQKTYMTFESEEELLKHLNESVDTTYPGLPYFSLDEDIEAVIWPNMEPRYYTDIGISMADPNNPNITGTKDFKNLTDYGIIYIHTHGFDDKIACGPLYENTPDNLYDMDEATRYDETDPYTTGTWTVGEVETSKDGILYSMEVYALTKNFFSGQDFSNSIVYINACSSYNFLVYSPFNNAKVFLGNSKDAAPLWCRNISYYFFRYMMEGYEQPVDIFKTDTVTNPEIKDPNSLPQGPMSAQKAVDTLRDVQGKVNGDFKPANPYPFIHPKGHPLYSCNSCELVLTSNSEDVYFPVPVNIIVHEE